MMLRINQFAFAVLSLFVIPVALGVDDKISKYIQNVIELHSSTQFGPYPLPLLRSCVPVSSENREDVLLCNYPVILIWQPEVQFHWIFPHGLKCGEQNCGGTLKATFWNDGSSERKNPRTIHHCEEICLIVTRNYACGKNSKHCFGGTHPSILKQFPDTTLIPFVLLHKAGVTRDLLFQIPKLVIAGMSFLEIELFLTELRRERYFYRYLAEFSRQSDKDITLEYVDIPLSNDVLTHFYIEYFRENEEYFNRKMSDLTATWLSCDHTFKVASNIGLLRGGKWMKQYDSLFAVMNELGQVVTWQFVYGQSYSTIETLLTSLKSRLDKKGCTLQGICIDNCCHWRKKLQQTFGPGIQVKLDIFHAVQRIGLAMSKKHSFHWRCLKDFSQIFRQAGDNRDERRQATPSSPDIIQRNLNEFLSKWKTVKYKDIPVLTEKNTQRNYQAGKAHRKRVSLNKDLKKNRIGVMLALAILSQFFHSWNQRKSHTTHASKGLIPPTISPTERKARGKSLHTENDGETFGIGIDRKNVTGENEAKAFQSTECNSGDVMNILFHIREQNSSHNRDESEPCQAPLQHSVPLDEEYLTDILYRSVCMLRIGETISNLSKSNSFKFRDLGFMDDVLKTLHASVQGDGDCLLTASFLQLPRLLHSDVLLNHLSRIGLTPSTDSSQTVLKLRKLIVAEWLENEDYYGLRNLCLNEQDIISYEENGVSGGALGDAMPLALANVLQLPIVLFTSIENFPVVVVSPRQQVPDAQPLYLAYQQQGPGHYDIAEFQQVTTGSSTEQLQVAEGEDTTPLNTYSCRCGQGRDRKDLSKNRCQIPSGKYSCRCECFNNKVACSSSCQCKNCSNIYGQRPEKKAGDLKQARKRARHDAQLNKQTSLFFMTQRGERVREGGWTNMEHCVFVHSLRYIEETEGYTIKALYHVYNTLVKLIEERTEFGSIRLVKKTEKELAAKYSQHCKEAALIESLMK
ncbi:hypothetical protein ACROYT_G001769 [Oculina patagonica]